MDPHEWKEQPYRFDRMMKFSENERYDECTLRNLHFFANVSSECDSAFASILLKSILITSSSLLRISPLARVAFYKVKNVSMPALLGAVKLSIFLLHRRWNRCKCHSGDLVYGIVIWIIEKYQTWKSVQLFGTWI